MIGFPLLPQYELIFADEKYTKWQWWRKNQERKWSIIPNATNLIYIPNNEDYKLKLECTPGILSEDSTTHEITYGITLSIETGIKY